MLKSVVMHDIPMDHVAAMERWYCRDHAPEINRRFGPWLQRHDSWLPVDAPPEARRFGYFNWRVTEGWWRELPQPGPQGNLAFTMPPRLPKVATGFFPVQPTEDFLGGAVQPHEKSVLRWYVLLRYPAGLAKEEGERWFLDVHAPEVMRQPGLFRFFSFRAASAHIPLPGEWPPGGRPAPESVLHSWDRLIELWYESFADWRQAVLQAPPRYTRPAWATRNDYPFVQPGLDLVSSFLLERPADEFWRDSRGYL
jgi:hypothetical protein